MTNRTTGSPSNVTVVLADGERRDLDVSELRRALGRMPTDREINNVLSAGASALLRDMGVNDADGPLCASALAGQNNVVPLRRRATDAQLATQMWVIEAARHMLYAARDDCVMTGPADPLPLDRVDAAAGLARTTRGAILAAISKLLDDDVVDWS